MDCVGTPTCSAAPVFVPGDGRRLSYVGYLRSGVRLNVVFLYAFEMYCEMTLREFSIMT